MIYLVAADFCKNCVIGFSMFIIYRTTESGHYQLQHDICSCYLVSYEMNGVWKRHDLSLHEEISYNA